MYSLLRLLYEVPGQVDRLVEGPDTRQLRLCERLLLLRLGHGRKAFGQDLDLASRLVGTAGAVGGVVAETAQLRIGIGVEFDRGKQLGRDLRREFVCLPSQLGRPRPQLFERGSFQEAFQLGQFVHVGFTLH